MTLFREHRGAYDDSMKTVMEVASMDQLHTYMCAKIPTFTRPFWTSYYGYDDRNKWLQWIVLSDQGVVGFTDGELK